MAIAANSTFGDGGVGSGSLNFSSLAVLGGFNQYIFTANAPVTFSGGFTNGGFYKAGSNSITLQSGTYPFANYIQVLNGTLTLNGATVNNQNDIRVVANQTNGTSRLVVNGGSLTGGQLRLGFADFGNTTAGGLASMATNIVDVAGLLNVGNNSVTMGRSAAWCELNLLTNGTLRTAKVQHADSTPNNTPEQFTFNGGTLQASTNSSADSFMTGLDNAYIMNGGAVIDSAGFAITIGQALQPWPSSTGGLTKIGAGTLTLSGANTYTGARVVNQGELVILTASTGGGAITVSNGASFGVTLATAAASLNASDATFGTASTHNGALDINFAAYAPDLVNAPLNLTGNLAANGTNTINITATNGFYVGQYPLIKYAGSMAPGAFSAFKLGNMPVGSAGVLVNNTGNQSIDLNVTSALPPPMTWTANTDSTWDTSGTLINWQTGASVPIAYTESGGVGAVVTFNDSAFSYSVNITTPVHPSGVTVSTSYGYTIGGSPIAGTGALTKSGANILTLTSSNSYSGGTTVAQGAVVLGASGALGSGVLTLSGGTLTSDSTTARTNLLAGVNITASGVILGDAVNTGRLNLGGTVNWNNAEKTLTIPSDVVLSGGSTNGSFSKTGTGVLTLQGTHAFTKLNDVFLGDVVLDGATATSSATSNIRVDCNVPNSQSRLVLTNGASFVNTVGSSLNIGATGGDTTSTNILDLAGRMATSSGAVAYLGASCALGGVNLLNGGVLEVGGVQSSTNTSFNGESRLNFHGGTLRANASSTTFLTGLTNVFVLNGGAIIDSSNYNITVTQPLLQSGSGGLTKNGNGVLTLDSINTYTNTTLVNAGTLSGTGTIAGPLTVGGNGSLAPGDAGIGTFTVNGALTLAGDSTNYVDINASNGTSDLVTNLTKATYGGMLVVSNLSGTPVLNQNFQIFSAVAAPVGNFSSIVPAPATGLAWSFNPTNGKLTAVTGVSPSASTNAYLTSVVLTPAGALSPSFATNGFSYTATNAFTDIPTVTVTNADSTATNTLFLNGVSQGAITSGVPSMALTLNVGSNNVAVQVVSQDLSVTNLYTVNVTKLAAPLSANAYLTALAISPAGTLSPAFTTNGLTYTATNAYANNPVTVTATSGDANATLQLSFNGGSFTTPVTNSLSIGSQTLNLAPSPLNTVAVKVTAQDGVTTNLYTVNVLLQPSLAAFKVTNSVVGSTNLVLTWPVDHTGYNLLTQTNNLNKGVSKNTNDWGTLGYTTTNAAVIPITKTNLNSYYRLVYP